MSSFGLPDQLLADLSEIVRKYPEVTSAKIFGSRAKGNFKKYSDVDIALFAQGAPKVISSIRDELAELDTIYTFDVLDYCSTQNPEIKAHIDRVGVEILSR